MKFSSINPSLGSSYKMTKKTYVFFSHFGGGFKWFVIKRWFFVHVKLSN